MQELSAKWESWNPVSGCSKVSAGCQNCYAERFAERWRGIPGHPYERGFDLQLRERRLDLPLHWRQPRRVFVESMGDLFHERVPEEYVRRVFAVMDQAPRHLFQLVTKRATRLAELAPRLPWPANLWMGVTVEHMATARRVDLLRSVPAAVRWICAEPLLGPLDGIDLAGIDWVIAGGESGPVRRPPDPRWVRDLRDRCIAADVPFFFKQWGGSSQRSRGRLLDGREWREEPQPTAAARAGADTPQATLW